MLSAIKQRDAEKHTVERICTQKATHLIIRSIDKNFVHNLEETGYISCLPIHHPIRIRVIHPHRLCDHLNTADVRVRALEDMLNWAELVRIQLHCN